MAVLRKSVVALVVLVLSAGGAQAVDLAAHRAIYDMTLIEAARSADISAMKGRMFLEWNDACDGWTVNQKVRMVSTMRDGPQVENHFNFSSWESYDGQRFRFAMRSLSMGEQMDQVAGTAELDEGGKGGEVRFTSPEGVRLDLPPRSMFPSAHLVLLVEKARAGERHFERPVFSGSGTDSLNPVSAFIGDPIAPGARPLADAGDSVSAAAFRSLSEQISWPIGLAYYPMTGQGAEPEFEVDYRLFESGIATDLTLNYGDFILSAVLEELELLPAPDC